MNAGERERERKKERKKERIVIPRDVSDNSLPCGEKISHKQ